MSKVVDTIALDEVPGFGKLLLSDIKEKKSFIDNDDLFKKGILEQIQQRKDYAYRTVLKNELLEQYKGFTISPLTQQNIDAITDEKSFTITSGHQLVIGGGPLYVLYKITTTIALCQRAKRLLPEYNFIPVFWLASEDHDKEEIAGFRLGKNTFKWETEQEGPVGEFSTKGILSLINEAEFFNADFIDLFKKAYAKDKLHQGSRELINTIFGAYGLVLIDGNSKALKALFKPVMKQEIEDKVVYHSVQKRNKSLEEKGYEPRIQPRELNLFFLGENSRLRLEFKGDLIQTADQKHVFTKSEILQIIDEKPERLSPNVLLRPMYQEYILPNLAFVGGPAEIEYWLQLDELFNALNLPVPHRLLRLSATLVQQKSLERLEKEKTSLKQVFGNEHQLINEYTKLHGEVDQLIEEERKTIGEQVDAIAEKASKIDPTLFASVQAEKAKILKSLEQVEGRLFKAQKVKLESGINRIVKIRSEVLPESTPQERFKNIGELTLNEIQSAIDLLLREGKFFAMNICVD